MSCVLAFSVADPIRFLCLMKDYMPVWWKRPNPSINIELAHLFPTVEHFNLNNSSRQEPSNTCNLGITADRATFQMTDHRFLSEVLQ